jgi:hypothetical protein
MSLSAVALATLLLASPTKAAEPDIDSASGLLKVCRIAVNTYVAGRGSPDELQQAALCIGFVSATWKSTDTINLTRAMATGKGSEAFEFCLPDGVGAAQLVRIVVKYLESHPERLSNPSYPESLTAIREAYPCGQRIEKR